MIFTNRITFPRSEHYGDFSLPFCLVLWVPRRQGKGKCNYIRVVIGTTFVRLWDWSRKKVKGRPE